METGTSRLAATMPRVNNRSCTPPKINRDDPATIAPEASSDMAVTINAPGSRMASGASRVRSGPSSRPALVAAKAAQASTKAASTGSRVAIRLTR